MIPFGSAVWFKPSDIGSNDAKKRKDLTRLKCKFEEKCACGIFMGYKLHSGGKWRNEYLVCDIRDLARQSLMRGARPIIRQCHIQTIREIGLTKRKYFPCASAYERANSTTDGIKSGIESTQQHGADEGSQERSATTSVLGGVCVEHWWHPRASLEAVRG